MQKQLTQVRGSGGFTLIELLVVIIVIGILIALAVPNFLAFQQRGRDTERKAHINQISDALEIHYGDNNFYPETLDADFVDNYLDVDELPTDPQGGDYDYTPANCTDGECQTYTLSASLENENDAQADEDGNFTVQSINRVTEPDPA